MAFEKHYTAKQVAEAVLKKTQELLAKSELAKAEARFGKSEQPKGEIHPKEHVEGEAEQPGARIESQKSPQANPAEAKEGNNELAGTTPTQVGQNGKNIPGGDEIKGHLKLAKFCGYMEAKRKMRGAPKVGI